MMMVNQMKNTGLLSVDDVDDYRLVLNPFCNDVRHFKTIFDINDAEGMMDFGVWILNRCGDRKVIGWYKIDGILELFYDLMDQSIKKNNPLSIIAEENFEELFLTMTFTNPFILKPALLELIEDLHSHCIIRENIACLRLNISNKVKIKADKAASIVPSKELSDSHSIETNKKKIRFIDDQEKELLRQSFVHKTSAADYVLEIGGDVLEEIRDLESLDNEWGERLARLEREPTLENIRNFADGVLGVYVRAITNLFEFTALAYALSSLGAFMKEHGESIIADNMKVKMLVMLTEHLGNDLASWREHIFELQDSADIHYLDSSFFSSCMQIEQIIGNTHIDSDNDNDMEFF